MGALEELQAAIAGVAGSAGPSIVGVGHRWRGGSGVVVGAGLVLTNAHNIDGDEMPVIFDADRQATGRVTGVDPDADLAVVAVDTTGATPVSWPAGGAETSLGSVVFGVARPGGRLRVTIGTVSSTERSFRGPEGRRITGAVEHTAPLPPGSSGGAIVDTTGRFLGLNTNRIDEGFYLAIPADEALRSRVDALARGETPVRPRLGIAVAPSGVARRLRRSVGLPERDGLLVRGVEDGSVAARAGIVEGDLIVEVAGRAVPDADALQEILASLQPGVPFEIRLLRGAEERVVTAQAGAASGEA